MMIKIKMNEMGESFHWVVIDNVKSVDYKYMDMKKGSDLYNISVDNEVPARWIDSYGELPDKRIALMIVNYRDKPDEMIFTDDTIYILNDEGKTCESIGVYN